MPKSAMAGIGNTITRPTSVTARSRGAAPRWRRKASATQSESARSSRLSRSGVTSCTPVRKNTTPSRAVQSGDDDAAENWNGVQPQTP